MSTERDTTADIEAGQEYSDSVFGSNLTVKYEDDEVVLVQNETEHHQLYGREQFEENVTPMFGKEDNRFKLIDNESE